MKHLLALLAPALLLGACDAPDPEAEDPFRQLSQARPAKAKASPPKVKSPPSAAKAAPTDPKAAPTDPKAAPTDPKAEGTPEAEANPPSGEDALAAAPKEAGAATAIEGQLPPKGEALPPMEGPVGADLLDPDSVVTVSGTVDVGKYKGPLQVDFIHLDQPYLDGHRPMLNALRMEEPGDFELKFPKDQGRIQVVTYLDLNDDGLGSGDSQAMWVEGPFKVEDDDIEDLKVVIDPSNPIPAPPLEGIELPDPPEGEAENAPPAPGEVILGPDGEPMPPPPDRAQPTPEAKTAEMEPVVGEDGLAPPPPEGRDAPKEEPNE